MLRKHTKQFKDKLRDLYLNQGWTKQQIFDKFNIRKKLLTRWIYKWNKEKKLAIQSQNQQTKEPISEPNLILTDNIDECSEEEEELIQEQPEPTNATKRDSDVLYEINEYDAQNIIDLINSKIKDEIVYFKDHDYDTYPLIKGWIDIKEKLENLFYVQLFNKKMQEQKAIDQRQEHLKMLDEYLNNHPEVKDCLSTFVYLKDKTEEVD